MRVALVIPVYNEAEAIRRVLDEVPPGCVDEVIVVDGGSSDGTQQIAQQAGARVVPQQGRGYGAACLTGVLATSADVIVFLDGDYSDPPAAIPHILSPVLHGGAALVLGTRDQDMEPGALPLFARWGNRLAVLLLRLLFHQRVTDLPSLKAIRREDLLGLQIQDLRYGWTSEMIARAAARRLPIVEIPIHYRVRLGQSKVSGTIRGSLLAGIAIIRSILRVRFMNTETSHG